MSLAWCYHLITPLSRLTLEKLSNKMDKFLDRFQHPSAEVSDKLERLGEGIKKLFHPNSRHDDPEEKRHDEKLEEIRARHRFQSFAKEREGNHVKWYVDAHDYFYAASELLESAQSCIFIQDWWLSPELYLRRPPSQNELWRLDRILKRKAEAGVKIFVIVYKEVNVSNTMNSEHTKHALEDLHPNIACMRHPDHFDGEETVLFWSHHQKVIVVDDNTACIGGLDLCFGRWDTSSHSLADCHIPDLTQTVWPGQDYNNARVQDFQEVAKWASNQQSRLEVPRMPWHDVHMMIRGPTVFDICQHFVERWNFIYNLKYVKKRGTHGRYELLAFPQIPGQGMPDDPSHPDHEPVTQHPSYEHWAQAGRRFLGMGDHGQTSSNFPSTDLGPKGNMKVQVVRSCGDWSNGTTTEHSIQDAYIQLIEQAQRFIYIENQFFITTCSTAKDSRIRNQIGLALANRIVQAARANEPFKVVVAIPCIPGFSGNLDNAEESGGTMAIMDWTYKAICRGPDSIFSHVQTHEVDPRKYISFYNLRSFDRIDYDPATLKQIEQAAGISYYEAEAALARIYLGESAGSEELKQNKEVTFKLAQKGESMGAGNRDMTAREGNTMKVDLPQSVDEARQRLRTWSEAASRYNSGVPASIATQGYSNGLENLPWLGSEQSERDAFVTEELYIHTKCMIVDDLKVIMGSANINDRSMVGDRDSEIALVVEDQDMIDSTMAGEYWKASRFAATLRRRLYKEHLGLLPPQSNSLQSNEPTRSMLPVNVPQEDELGSREDQLVADPMGRELEEMWNGRASVNTEAFNKVFRCVPAAGILNWNDYAEYVPSGPNAPKVCHVAPCAGDVHEVKRELSRIQGHLVEMPLDFLEQDKMYREGKAVNLVTMDIYT
ncbi:hypothetical protein PCANC_20318 [Puccinia coronata f. sp. avenae]|uniref:Phospholipase n=1 Tax=Puccinia coronata f. sp. avenae TaxID=200324 RepID=A0A2N5SDC9_9BASI|nr:hypothetical protein PCANC_20318 [Puccinia coronata f. sp. avenae]